MITSPRLDARIHQLVTRRQTICAWCPDFDPRDPANAGVSHGLCPTCAAKLHAEMDAQEARR